MPSSAPAPEPAVRKTGRPFILDPLFRRLTDLPGVGPRTVKLFQKICGGERIVDLLWHKPTGVVDRRFAPKIKDAPPGHIATLTIHIDKHLPSAKRTQPYKIIGSDETGTITLVFFNAHRDYLEKHLPVGGTVIVSGAVEQYQGRPQMTHPDAIGTEEDRAAIQTIEPVYPLTAGLTNRTVRKATTGALATLPDLPEWQDEAWITRQGWPGWRDAMKAMHAPTLGDNDDSAKARARLAFDELLANQLALALVRHNTRKRAGRAFAGDGRLRKKIREVLPFNLTNAQERSLAEIYTDMAAPEKMLRLLQGDVGSGKTIVAALAMMAAVECGAQAAIMAPTEILARQHEQNMKLWLDAAGVPYVTLTGRNKGKERTVILEQIASGAAKVIIGTHALFQEDIAFADLGMAVIDEQHRFGVHQRLMLAAKGRGVDVLVMTATPIPRTLALTAYGDMDVSRLDEKPPGRKPVETLLIPHDKIDQVVDGLARRIKDGARVYWVCPLVEESEILDLAAAQERYEILQARFGTRVGLIHGRLKPDEKDDVMARFAHGDLDILVATTVIEVGVNVPEATIMVIEHAERFGLAQLHQLRGRVGRGGDKSYCFLIYTGPLGETARERLKMMRDTEDGFLIAEKDLELRGAGDILGTQQSGDILFRLADLSQHAGLLAAARDDARLILSRDPDLTSARGNSLRVLLYLFERDQAIRLLTAG